MSSTNKAGHGVKTFQVESLKSRATASKILVDVLKNKKSLRDSLVSKTSSKVDPFVKELCYGVLRFYFQLDFLLLELTQRVIKNTEIKALLLVGLYQIFFLEKADYAVVSETVNAARHLKKNWATQFINAVLRNALRSREALLCEAQNHLPSVFSHPMWMIEKIQQAYPIAWREILHANNERPPMTLRLNIQKSSMQNYLTMLDTKGIQATKTAVSDYGVQLKDPMPVEQLCGFLEGFVSVQDEAAQLAASLLELYPGAIVLDACAAPGGKTTHILELEPALQQVVAVDCDPKRLQLIQENLSRLQLSAELICADIKKINSRWPQPYFDRILLDVPCSATGVIRRHPDIKFLRQPTDIAQLAHEQYEILMSVWPLLKPGGILLYATCSVLPDENSNLLERFLQCTSNAEEVRIDAKWGKKMQVGRQILPGEYCMDGFYFARLRKM
jgi:16S rRNA (cytosine967-C5)-methyltransferase